MTPQKRKRQQANYFAGVSRGKPPTVHHSRAPTCQQPRLLLHISLEGLCQLVPCFVALLKRCDAVGFCWPAGV